MKEVLWEVQNVIGAISALPSHKNGVCVFTRGLVASVGKILFTSIGRVQQE